MSYTLTTIDDGHIIRFTAHSDFNMQTELVEFIREARGLLEAGPDQIVMVSDARDLNVNFNDVIAIGSTARNADAQAIVKSPKLVKVFIVVNSRVLELSLKGLNSANFGFVDVTIMDTVENAVNAARTLLYGQSKAL